MGEYEKLVEQLRTSLKLSSDDIVLPTSLGNIQIQNLTFLKGWNWKLFSIGFPGTEQPMTLGGAPVILCDYVDEKGWVILAGVYFRSPYGTLNFETDSWKFSLSPYLANIVGTNLPTSSIIWNPVYNPFTPLGPLFGLAFSPSYVVPYERRLRITFNLPVGSPIAATNIFTASIGKLYITNYGEFLKSLKRFNAEQMTGNKIDRNI